MSGPVGGGAEWTAAQRRAIGASGKSLLVSASAGSGKTSVLAERVVHLLTHEDESVRCDARDLLVVTFTEAAAAEMRTRIEKKLRDRLAAPLGGGPAAEERLRAQIALLPTAQISTIHAFCLAVIRAAFHEAAVDPSAAILDADEAALLEREVLDDLFSSLLGAETPLARDFRSLVDDVALGRLETIRELALSLAAFLSSLPPDDDWASRQLERLDPRGSGAVLAEHAAEMALEIERQEAHARAQAEWILARLPEGDDYGSAVAAYADALSDWHADLTRGGAGAAEAVRESIRAYGFAKAKAKRGLDDDGKRRRELARAAKERAEKSLFETRLKKRFALFTEEESRDGLARIFPYARTLLALAGEFRESYRRAKRRMDVLDFADLERHAALLLLPQGSATARGLRDRFRHVLVDEVQDVNPLQMAILRAVSREDDPERSANLFCVGDVKQSIYRFRLAEPALFVERERAQAAAGARGENVFLQENFRSRKTILDGVNAIFRSLMREGVGLVSYDGRAELRPGTPAQDSGGTPTRVLVVERDRERERGSGDEDDEANAEGGGGAAADEIEELESVEREALVIGDEILSIVGRERPNGSPYAYRDVAILLRSARHRAGRIASVLASLGIPAFAAEGQTIFESLEVQDVLALLRVLDNARQDIPLAATLRNGMAGERFSEDDLVLVRLHARAAPFHEAARLYARSGADEALRGRIARAFERVDAWRAAARRRPLAEVLSEIYDASGILAFAGGLPSGAQRRANLLDLHERARQFGAFERQGLHRFLRFLETLRAEEREIGAPPAIGEGEDVVRIMTIHQSKGLQFPVVFVADLAKRFNDRDSSGSVLFDRGAGIGMKAVDRERMIEYPTAAHQLVALRARNASHDEELRILYVAMTRAEERLVLVGSDSLARVRGQYAPGDGGEAAAAARPVTAIDVLSADNALDWVFSALRESAPGSVAWDGAGAAEPLFAVRTIPASALAGLRLAPAAAEAGAAEELRSRAAALEPLPADEVSNPAAAARVMNAIDWVYPHAAATRIRSVRAASDAAEKDAAAFQRDPDERADEPVPAAAAPRRRFPARATGKDAAALGTATHRVLERIDLARAATEAHVRAEIERLAAAGLVTREEAAAIDAEGIAWFFGSTPLGEAIRSAGAESYRREVVFLSAEPAREWLSPPEAPPEGAAEETVVVRGSIDAVLVAADWVEIVDFKTDRPGPAGRAARADAYAPVLRAYARAAERLWRRPARQATLVFLSERWTQSLFASGEIVPGTIS